MPKLLRFPLKSGRIINIPQQVGAYYCTFGILLLNDETGVQVDAITTQYRGDVEKINFEILKLWMRGKGKPVSWDTLIGVLKDIGNIVLACDIEDGLHDSDHSICKSEWVLLLLKFSTFYRHTRLHPKLRTTCCYVAILSVLVTLYHPSSLLLGQ